MAEAMLEDKHIVNTLTVDLIAQLKPIFPQFAETVLQRCCKDVLGRLPPNQHLLTNVIADCINVLLDAPPLDEPVDDSGRYRPEHVDIPAGPTFNGPIHPIHVAHDVPDVVPPTLTQPDQVNRFDNSSSVHTLHLAPGGASSSVPTTTATTMPSIYNPTLHSLPSLALNPQVSSLTPVWNFVDKTDIVSSPGSIPSMY